MITTPVEASDMNIITVSHSPGGQKTICIKLLASALQTCGPGYILNVHPCDTVLLTK